MMQKPQVAFNPIGESVFAVRSLRLRPIDGGAELRVAAFSEGTVLSHEKYGPRVQFTDKDTNRKVTGVVIENSAIAFVGPSSI